MIENTHFRNINGSIEFRGSGLEMKNVLIADSDGLSIYNYSADDSLVQIVHSNFINCDQPISLNGGVHLQVVNSIFHNETYGFY